MFLFFFFNDTATTEIYTLSLHDALPISQFLYGRGLVVAHQVQKRDGLDFLDRKSTRLNSSHANISYAVFCLKKKIQVEYLINQPIQFLRKCVALTTIASILPL